MINLKYSHSTKHSNPTESSYKLKVFADSQHPHCVHQYISPINVFLAKLHAALSIVSK